MRSRKLLLIPIVALAMPAMAASDKATKECAVPNGYIGDYMGYQLGMSLDDFKAYADCMELNYHEQQAFIHKSLGPINTKVTLNDAQNLPSQIKALDRYATTSLLFEPSGKLAEMEIKWEAPSFEYTDKFVAVLTNTFVPTKTITQMRGLPKKSSIWEFSDEKASLRLSETTVHSVDLAFKATAYELKQNIAAERLRQNEIKEQLAQKMKKYQSKKAGIDSMF